MEASSPALRRSTGFADFLYRHRFVLFGLWLVHAVLLHALVLGYMSGDGLSYRVTPVIELLQHGELGKWKYPFDWTLRGYVPFVELAHLPFLKLFGLAGLLIGFPLVVFPLCVGAVLRLVREVTSDDRAALFGAFAYVAMPMVNAQVFAGLVDFAVAGILANWLYALLRLRRGVSPVSGFVPLVIATFMLSMARQQGLYIAVALFPFVMYAMFGERTGWHVRITSWASVARATGSLLVGAMPAIALQVYRALTYGSPIAPSELKVLGVKLASGVPMKQYLIDAGIHGDDPASLASGFFNGWVWHVEWPMGAFYHSQWFAAGLLTIFGLVTLPLFVRNATRVERVLVVGLIVVSLLARDFALPRWAYAITIALVLVVGRSMAAAISSRRARPLFWAGCAILFAQLARPEFDLLQIGCGYWFSPRVNVVGSPWFHHGPGELRTLPDRNYEIAIVQRTLSGYIVPLFGRRLKNQIVGTVPADELGDHCAGVRVMLAAHPTAVFIDELDLTNDCARTCVLAGPKACKLWSIHLGDVLR